MNKNTKTGIMRKFIRIGENGKNETYTGKTAKQAASKAFVKSCTLAKNKGIDVDIFELKFCLEEIETGEKYHFKEISKKIPETSIKLPDGKTIICNRANSVVVTKHEPSPDNTILFS